jgi:hypothetical protein
MQWNRETGTQGLLESGLAPGGKVDSQISRLGDTPLSMTYLTGGPVDVPATVRLHRIGSSFAGHRPVGWFPATPSARGVERAGIL